MFTLQCLTGKVEKNNKNNRLVPNKCPSKQKVIEFTVDRDHINKEVIFVAIGNQPCFVIMMSLLSTGNC